MNLKFLLFHCRFPLQFLWLIFCIGSWFIQLPIQGFTTTNSAAAIPIWGDGYLFQDGSFPEARLQAQLIQLSWAVPIETFAQQAGELVFPNFTRSRSGHFVPSQTEHREMRSHEVPQSDLIEPKSPSILPANGWLW